MKIWLFESKIRNESGELLVFVEGVDGKEIIGRVYPNKPAKREWWDKRDACPVCEWLVKPDEKLCPGMKPWTIMSTNRKAVEREIVGAFREYAKSRQRLEASS